MAFLLTGQQGRLQATKSSLVDLISAGGPAVQNIPPVPYPELPGNKSVSGRR
jgi:hypothetical protein